MMATICDGKGPRESGGVACELPTTSDRTDCCQNGGPGTSFSENSAIKSVSVAQGKSGNVRGVCEACKKLPEESKGEVQGVQCGFCTNSYCFPCAEINKKGDQSASRRKDFLWTCPGCRDGIKSMGIKAFVVGKKETTQSEGKNVILDKLSKIEADIAGYRAEIASSNSALKAGLENTIQETLNQQIPTTLDRCLETVHNSVNTSVETSVNSTIDRCIETVDTSITKSMAKAWSSTLFGEGEFPSVDSDEWRFVTSSSKRVQKTLPQLITKSVTEASKKEQRKNNIILYKVPEPQDKEANDRLKSDKNIVQQLMSHLKVRGEPVKVYRLGKYEEAKKNQGSRPIKVEFENHEKQTEIMSNTRKMKDAPEHLKGISLSYDLSEDQRDELKKMVNQAKKDTLESKNSVWKVRGYPGNWTLREFKITSP